MRILGGASDSPIVNTEGLPRNESPAPLNLTKATETEDRQTKIQTSIDEDGPSAADYDPMNDMEEDRRRNNQHLHQTEISAVVYDEKSFTDQEVLMPKSADKSLLPSKGKGTKADDDLDMFDNEDNDEDADMFAEKTVKIGDRMASSAQAVEVPKTKGINMSTLDDWDDPEGYYKIILGELLEGRYHVQSNLGKGMFSGVVRATDNITHRTVAIKIIRNNETMKKAGLKEIDILLKLVANDPDDKKHIVRLESSFEYKGHLCMVFENLRYLPFRHDHDLKKSC